MQKVIPHLWFAKEAKEAAAFYASVFPDSKTTHTTVLRNTPSGDTDIVTFELWNQKFMAISAGPLFKINPSVSFVVNFDPLLFGSPATGEKDAREKIDMIWDRLAEGGTVLMPIDKYPFSERYGWVQDKYGVSWQLILTNAEGDPRPAIMPFLMFVNSKCGKTEEAINFYLSVFKNSKLGAMHRYGKDMAPDKEGTIMFADFLLENTWFAAMDSAHAHKFDFNEAISFIINCNDQDEIDYYWKKLSAVPESEQCGWLKDKYGVSWQITSSDMEKILSEGSREQVDRVMRVLLPMKKLNIAKLKEAYEGK